MQKMVGVKWLLYASPLTRPLGRMSKTPLYVTSEKPPEQIRDEVRTAYRTENMQPKIKWAAFQEQRRREDIAAHNFSLKQSKLKKKLAHPDPQITKFIDKLRKCLQKRMKEVGGNERSVIRAAFLAWDGDNSGELDVEELKGAFRSLGLLVSNRELHAVVEYYDKEGDGEITYEEMVEDVSRGTRHFLTHPQIPSFRDNGPEVSESARPKRKDARKDTFIQAFLKKLRKSLWIQMREKGEYERILIRRAFLNWDGDASGQVDADELKGAMSQLGMHVSPEEARRIVEFYDLHKCGAMSYKDLVEDVAQGIPTFMEHPESEGKKTIDQDEDLQLAGRMFTARPTARSDNRLVERFKTDLVKMLEKSMCRTGGTPDSILRDAFLFW